MPGHRRNAPNLTVEWIDRRREPQCPPDPKYPHGIDLDISGGHVANTCQTALPYPAKRIGYYVVNCSECQFQGLITTAGRADDPRSVKIACKFRES